MIKSLNEKLKALREKEIQKIDVEEETKAERMEKLSAVVYTDFPSASLS